MKFVLLLSIGVLLLEEIELHRYRHGQDMQEAYRNENGHNM